MKPLEILPSEYHSRLTLDRSNVFGDESFLSKSSLFELYQSSLYKWRFFPRQFPQTPSMVWGSLVDCLVTTPEDFDAQFIVSPFDSWRTDEAKAWKVRQAEAGLNIVTQDLIDEGAKAAKNLTQTHQRSAEIIAKSKKQVVLVNRVRHPSIDRAFNLKGLLDFAPDGEDYLVDLKTINNFTPSGFERAMARFGYHVQASHYLNMWNALNPNDQRTRFRIIWQDSSSPYEVAVTEIPEVDIADGADLFNHLLGKILRAADMDYWPMRFDEPILLARAQSGIFQEGQEIDGYQTAPENNKS